MNPTPEQIDKLALALHAMGVQVPPRDTAFFQAAVRQWLEGLSNDAFCRTCGGDNIGWAAKS